MTPVIVVALLLLANALFVAAEFAIVAVPRTAVEHRASKGEVVSARLLALLSSPQQRDRFIATAQLGITIASLGLGMYGEHTLAAWFEPHLTFLGESSVITSHAAASVLAVAALTYLHIFLGEMIPKALALSRAEATARAVFWPMRVLLLAVYPVVVSLDGVGALLLRLVGVRRQTDMREESYSSEELQLIVEESEAGGALLAESGRLVRELFEFDDLTAGEAMVPRVRVVGIPVGASPEDLRQLLRTHRHTRYPVYEGDLDHIVGMLHVKDLLRRLILEEAIAAADVRQLPMVPETCSLDDVLATMQRAHAHMAVVIDEHGGTAGVLSLEDLAEEVIGEIDEDVPRSPGLVALPDGTVRVEGTLRLDELGQHFDVALHHDEVDSVSGLVMALLDRPPTVGDSVEFEHFELTVLSVSGHGAKEVRAKLVR
ncbi:MAG: HlyC/CorC family transporter [Acidobacteria bacterium]|nr:HlyC/CorC family transporter [Acidobacteriota bacterium]